MLTSTDTDAQRQQTRARDPLADRIDNSTAQLEEEKFMSRERIKDLDAEVVKREREINDLEVRVRIVF